MSSLSPLPASIEYLASMLPYEPNKRVGADLKKGLLEYQFLLGLVNQAYHSLENKEFQKFDSLVGENSCQTRVLKIALNVIHSVSNFNALDVQILKANRRIKELFSSGEIDLLIKEKSSLQDVLDSHHLDLALSRNEMFILQSYLLAEAKEQNSPEEIFTSLFRIEKASIDNLKLETSNSFKKHLVRKARILLSKASVQFMREIALKLKDASLITMFSPTYEKEHNGCLCIPMFWSIKAVLKILHKEGIPLIIHTLFLETVQKGYRVIGGDAFFYSAEDKQSLSYVKDDPKEADLEKPACVIQGVACLKDGAVETRAKWKESISAFPITDIILAAAADHRQYPNPDITPQVKDEEYEQYKLLAEREGFSLRNPALFFTQHVYLETVKHIFRLTVS
ncbi:MAG: hypothetical protein KGJ02_06880 [Verrucomicrobiota bacterium]|nr:hypothetical protein [Verrucomicrobiota bacterium]